MNDEPITLTVRGPDGLTFLAEALRLSIEDAGDMIGDNITYKENANDAIYEMGCLLLFFIDNAQLNGCISTGEMRGLIDPYLDLCKRAGAHPITDIANWKGE